MWLPSKSNQWLKETPMTKKSEKWQEIEIDWERHRLFRLTYEREIGHKIIRSVTNQPEAFWKIKNNDPVQGRITKKKAPQ